MYLDLAVECVLVLYCFPSSIQYVFMCSEKMLEDVCHGYRFVITAKICGREPFKSHKIPDVRVNKSNHNTSKSQEDVVSVEYDLDCHTFT